MGVIYSETGLELIPVPEVSVLGYLNFRFFILTISLINLHSHGCTKLLNIGIIDSKFTSY